MRHRLLLLQPLRLAAAVAALAVLQSQACTCLPGCAVCPAAACWPAEQSTHCAPPQIPACLTACLPTSCSPLSLSTAQGSVGAARRDSGQGSRASSRRRSDSSLGHHSGQAANGGGSGGGSCAAGALTGHGGPPVRGRPSHGAGCGGGIQQNQAGKPLPLIIITPCAEYGSKRVPCA